MHPSPIKHTKPQPQMNPIIFLFSHPNWKKDRTELTGINEKATSNLNTAWQPNYASLVNSVDHFSKWLFCTSLLSHICFSLIFLKASIAKVYQFYLQNVSSNHSFLSFIASQDIISRVGHHRRLQKILPDILLPSPWILHTVIRVMF